MPHKTAFHQGLHCLPKYQFIGIQNENSLFAKVPIYRYPQCIFKEVFKAISADFIAISIVIKLRVHNKV